MTYQDEKNQLSEPYPLVTFKEFCRRFLSIAEVLHDATDSWLRGGIAEEACASSEGGVEAIPERCHRLLWGLTVAKVLLGARSDALDKYESLHVKSGQGLKDHSKTEVHNWPYLLLSLVCNAARETADHVRSICHISSDWVAEQGLDRDEKRLEYVLVSLDCARRDILKQLAELVMIFDDYDDPDNDQPCEAWLSRHAASGDD